MDREEIRELYAIRGAMEGLATSEATIRAHLKRSEVYLLLHWSLTHEGQRN
jgi:DNA-binding GntR family transcriptional regulator